MGTVQARRDFEPNEIIDMSKQAAKLYLEVSDLKGKRTDINDEIKTREKDIDKLERKIDTGYEMVHQKIQMDIDGELH